MICAPCSLASSRMRDASCRAPAICAWNSAPSASASALAFSASANCWRMFSWRSVRPLLTCGMTYLASTNITIAKATISKRIVPFGTRKLLSAEVVSGFTGGPVCSEVLLSSLAENEDEQRHEGEVDEVGRFGQTD